jgi:hypothetical protein
MGGRAQVEDPIVRSLFLSVRPQVRAMCPQAPHTQAHTHVVHARARRRCLCLATTLSPHAYTRATTTNLKPHTPAAPQVATTTTTTTARTTKLCFNYQRNAM